MKRIALAAAAAALLSTAIPAAASSSAPQACCSAGTAGTAGNRSPAKQLNCRVSTKLNCRLVPLPFWLP